MGGRREEGWRERREEGKGRSKRGRMGGVGEGEKGASYCHNKGGQ